MGGIDVQLFSLLLLVLANAYVTDSSPLPPPWVQKLIESKSGGSLKGQQALTPPPVLLVSAALIPQKIEPSPPFWTKWKSAYASKGWKGKGKVQAGMGNKFGGWNH